MASYPFWTDQELAALDECIDAPDWLQRASAKINRSVKSLKIRMSKRRAELGMEDGRRSPLVKAQEEYDLDDNADDMDAFNARAAAASQALLAAIQRAGVRP